MCVGHVNLQRYKYTKFQPVASENKKKMCSLSNCKINSKKVQREAEKEGKSTELFWN